MLHQQLEALDSLHVKKNVEARSMKKLSTKTVEDLFKTLDAKLNDRPTIQLTTSQGPTSGKLLKLDLICFLTLVQLQQNGF